VEEIVERELVYEDGPIRIMSAVLDSRLTSDVIDDSSKITLNVLRISSITHSASQEECLRPASKVEIPLYCNRIAEIFDVNVGMLDTDIMSYKTAHCAFSYSHRVPNIYSGDIVRVCTEDVHVGYVRLICEKSNTELQLKELGELADKTMHGPAVLYNEQNVDIEFQTLANATNSRSLGLRASVDAVYAVHSPYWPVESSERVTRRRLRGFPSKSVMKQVVRYGCDFVQVSHNRISNNNEWRFSFLKAELFITASWSTSQSIDYTTLWVLNKRIASIHAEHEFLPS